MSSPEPAGRAPVESATDPADLASAAAAALADLTGSPRHDIALVLGSGWGETAAILGDTLTSVPAEQIPGFAATSVPGHTGTISSVAIGSSGRRALVLGARTHLYEGRGVRAVVHGVRTAAAAGCRAVVLTNGAGSIRPDWATGTPVLIADHVNLTAASPLEGATFVDLTDLYSPRLRALAREVDPDLPEGVYAQLPGPHFETPAEIRMLRTLGADLVGMSTALEAIAARAAGLEVLAVSLVTNPAAGVTPGPLSHEDVLTAGHAAATRCGRLLSAIVERM